MRILRSILCGLSRRNIEQFSQSHNFQQKITNPKSLNKRLKLKDFCAPFMFTILERFFSVLGFFEGGKTDGRSLRSQNEISLTYLHSLKFLLKATSFHLPYFSEFKCAPAYKVRREISLKEKHEQKSIGNEAKLWHITSQKFSLWCFVEGTSWLNLICVLCRQSLHWYLTAEVLLFVLHVLTHQRQKRI